MVILRNFLIACLFMATGSITAQVERSQQSKDGCKVPMFIDWSRTWLSDFLTWEAESELEELCNIYSYLTHNVRRKRRPFYKRKTKKYHPGCVLIFKAATERNYANMFRDMCEKRGIKSFVVQGYVKDVYYCPEDDLFLDDHYWNVVQIDSQWYHVDVSWGAGYFKKREHRPVAEAIYHTLGLPYVMNRYKWKKDPTDDYYLADPREFAKTHLPADPRWQLLETPIPMSVFEKGDQAIDRWIRVSGQDSNRIMDVKLQIEHYDALQPELKINESGEIAQGFNEDAWRRQADAHKYYAASVYQRMETNPPFDYEARKRIYRRSLEYFNKTESDYTNAKAQMKAVHDLRVGRNDDYNKKYTDFNNAQIKYDQKQIIRNDRILDKIAQTNKKLDAEIKRIRQNAANVSSELKELNRPKRPPTDAKLAVVRRNDSMVVLNTLKMEDETSLRKFIKSKNREAQDSIEFFRNKVRRLLLENDDDLITNIDMTIDYDRCNKDDVLALKDKIGVQKTKEERMRSGIDYEDKETLAPNFKIQKKGHQTYTTTMKKTKSLLERNKKINMDDKGEDQEYEKIYTTYEKETRNYIDNQKDMISDNRSRVEPIRREQQRLRKEIKKFKKEIRLENHRRKKENKWHDFVQKKEFKRYRKSMEYVTGRKQYIEDQIQWLDLRTKNKARDAAELEKEQNRAAKDAAREKARKEKEDARKERDKAEKEARKNN